jgi:thymidylate kinase
MIVICLEGCHGSGKSSLCGHFAAAGYTVLDEAFLDMPEYALHPQSLLMETTWVCAWFERILRRAAEDKKKDQPDEVFIADRSPFSAVFYAAKGFLLKEVIKEQMVEVLSQGGIEIHTVLVKVSVPCLPCLPCRACLPLSPRARCHARAHKLTHPHPRPSLQVDTAILWERIQARLRREPERVRYNEGKREWMQKTLDFYNHFEWDAEVSNDDGSLAEVMENVLTVVKRRSRGFGEVLVRKRSFQTLSLCGAGGEAEAACQGASSKAARAAAVATPQPQRPSIAHTMVTPVEAALAQEVKAERFAVADRESPTSIAAPLLSAAAPSPPAPSAAMVPGTPAAMPTPMVVE